jgi:hypothetical protein
MSYIGRYNATSCIEINPDKPHLELLRNTHVALKSCISPYKTRNLSSQRDNLRELRAMQNKDKIYAPEEFTLHGAFFCLLFYSAPARHEQGTKRLRMASR